MDLFDQEAVMDGTEAGATGVEGEAPGAVQPDTPVETAPAVEAEPAAPAWAPSQDDWQALQTELQQLRSAVTPAAVPQTAPQLEDYADSEGNITPAALQKYMDEQISRGVDARLAPVQPVLDQTITERGNQLVEQELERLQGTVGAFDAKLARNVAEGLVRETGDPQTALHQAAKLVHEMQKSIGAAAIEEYRTTLANVGNAHSDGPAAGTAVDRPEIKVGDPDRYKIVGENWAARNGAAA